MVRFYFACQVILDKSIWAYINRINGNWFDGRRVTANRFYSLTALPQTSAADLLFGCSGASTWQFKLTLNSFAANARNLIWCSAILTQAHGRWVRRCRCKCAQFDLTPTALQQTHTIWFNAQQPYLKQACVICCSAVAVWVHDNLIWCSAIPVQLFRKQSASIPLRVRKKAVRGGFDFFGVV